MTVIFKILIGFVLMMGISQSALTAGDAQPTVEEILALDADIDYGEYLAGECLTCHQVSGAAKGVPVVAGLPVEYIVTALLAYQDGSRSNQVMETVASALGSEELAALALYFNKLTAN